VIWCEIYPITKKFNFGKLIKNDKKKQKIKENLFGGNENLLKMGEK